MKYNRVAYLCDGKGCGKQCANLPKEEWDKHPCHHTTDESTEEIHHSLICTIIISDPEAVLIWRLIDAW